MTGYKTRILSAVALMAIYIFVATETRLSRYQEFFPFFSWSLFSYSAPIRQDITLSVISLNGEMLEEPVLIGELREQFPTIRRNIKFRKSLLHFAEAVTAGREKDADRLRQFIENRHLSQVGSIQYQLVAIEYRPLDRYRDNQDLKIIKSLGQYHYE